MNKCSHCGKPSADDGDLLKEPVSPAPEIGDQETSAKTEILDELIQLMQASSAKKLKPKDDENDGFTKAIEATPITGTN